MPFCKKCGAQLEEGEKFCSSCGQPVDEPIKESDLGDKLQQLNDTPDMTSQFDQSDIDSNKGLALLSYLSFLFLIPLFAGKDSKYCRFHVNQGLVLFILEVIVGIVGSIPLIGWIVDLVGGIACFVLALIGILNALNGKAKELPIIGKFRLLK